MGSSRPMVDATLTRDPLPVGACGKNSVGWWGMLCLIATEGSLFAYLLFSYAYLAVQRGPAWLPEQHPSLALSGPNTVILLLSSVAVWWGEEGVKRQKRGQHIAGLAVGIVLGLIFLVVQLFEWKTKPFGLTSSSYGSLFFTVTGFHMIHVIVGLGMMMAVLAWSLMGYFSPRHHARVTVAAIYWHFVDAVWLCVFSAFYVSPYLMG